MKKQNETAANVENTNEVMNANETTVNVENTNETAENVENADTESDTKDADGKDLTPEQMKAKQILRATLPNLKAVNLNFEKRTGNFFTGVIEKVAKLDNDGNARQRADGSIIYETDAQGKPVEKLRRLVVDLTQADDEGNETGILKPEYESAREEINAKRAAALVLDGEKRRKKIEAEREEALKAVAAAEMRLSVFDVEMTEAKKIVAEMVLPEGTATREKLSEVKQRAESAEAKNAAMRAKLIELGIDPDTIL